MEASLAATGMFEVLATKAVRFIMDSVTPPSSTVNLRKALTHVIILMYDCHRDNPRFTGLTLTVSANWYQLIWYILKRDAFFMGPHPPPPGIAVGFSGNQSYVPESRIFLPTGLGVTDLSFYLPFGLQESNFSEFMGTAYKSNSTSKLRK